MGLIKNLATKIFRISPAIKTIYTGNTRNIFYDIEITPSQVGSILASTDLVRKMQLCDIVEKRDSTIQSQLQTRKLAIIGKKWEILPKDETSEAQQQAELIRRLFESWQFDDFCYGLHDAILKGFSVYRIPRWESQGNYLLPVEPEFIEQSNFYYNYNTKKLQFLNPQSRYENIEDYPDYFIVHYFQGKGKGYIYGGLIQSLAWLWCFQSFTMKYWLMVNEKFAMPVVIGYWDENTSPEDIEVLKSAVENIGIDFSAALPKNTSLNFLKASTGDVSGSFKGFLEFMRKEKAFIILGQDASMQGTPGELGKGEERSQVRQDILEADCKREAQTINSLIRRIIDKNFVNPLYPVFKRHYERPEDLNHKADLYLKIQKIGYPLTKELISKEFNVPIPEAGETILKPQQQTMPFGMKEVIKLKETPVEEIEKKPLIERLKEKYEQIMHNYFIKINSFDDVKALKLEPLAKAIKPLIQRAIELGMLEGFKKPRQKYNQKIKARLKDKGYAFQEVEELYIPEDMLDLYPALSEQALSYLENYSFAVSRIAAKESIDKIRDEIQKAIKEGKTFKQWKENLKETIADLTEIHKETIFRTNIATAQAYGQYESDKALGDMLWGYRRYTAGDDRVRPEHAELEGYTAPKDDIFWLYNTPPHLNGECEFNCRCGIEEIFSFEAPEDWDKGYTPPEGVEPGYPWEKASQWAEAKLAELGIE